MRMSCCSRSSVNSAPSRPYSRIEARKWPREVGSRTVLSASTRSTSTGGGATALMSCDREHLDVAQGRHRIGHQVLLAQRGIGHQRLAQLVGEHLVLEVHWRVEPILGD